MGKIILPNGNIFKGCLSARYLLALLGSLGMAIVYGLKVNLSITIVSMINHTALSNQDLSKILNDNDVCTENKYSPNVHNTTEKVEDGPFTWPGTLQGTMLSSYFWGYIIAQIPGGRIAELYSAKWVMFFAVAINVACTLFTPLAAKIHFLAMLLMRILEGIGGGVTFPAMHVLLANWSPPSERSVMSSMVYAGTAFGTVLSLLSSGLIAGSVGWEAVFYVMGGVSGMWLILWALLIADHPDKQAYIDEDERQFIVESLGGNKKKNLSKFPWKSVIKSSPFYAILISHMFSNWGWYMVLIELPQYMKDVFKFNITQNALLTAFPFLSMWIFSIILSNVLDSLLSRNVINTTQARKISTFIAGIVPMVCFVILSFISCLKVLAVFLTTLAITAMGGMFSGFLSNHIDIAPNYAGTLMALTNTAATIPGILVPIFVGKLTQADSTITSWRIIFWTTIILYLIEVIVYGIYASGEEEPWNRSSEEDNVESQPLKSQDEKTVAYDSTQEKGEPIENN